MNSIFSYDSPLMQILTYIGDLIILNFFYILCCVPVFTIGAAQAGLYTAMRVLNDKEDDSSALAAFFRGFRNGFGTVTVSWGLVGLLFLVCALAGIVSYANQLPAWLCLLPLGILGLFMSLIPAFHSRFGCTVKQLYRNVFLLFLCHPLRSVATAALMWIPLIVLCCDIYTTMTLTPLWLTLYFSTAVLFGELFLRKPFQVLVEEFNRCQEEERIATDEALPEPEEKKEKIFSDEPVE